MHGEKKYFTERLGDGKPAFEYKVMSSVSMKDNIQYLVIKYQTITC
jgi:hypothetical protein